MRNCSAKFEGSKAGGPTCWGLFEEWVKLRKPAPATVNRWRCVFQDLEAHFPARAASTIREPEARTWKDGLLTEERSAGTVRDIWVNASSTVFGWALEHKKLTGNPFADLKVDVPRPTKTRESQAFTDEEIGLILRATTVPPQGTLAQHHRDCRRWVPWLCAYTGARPGEMTQLRAEDVRKVQGAWCVTITPEAGSVKTGNARTVPLHEHLIEQGFLAFIQERSSGPLFYNPNGARKRKVEDVATNPAASLAAKSRVRLGEWVREVGVTDPGVRPNHAWRHTFKRKAARAGLEKRIRDGFCGHAPETVGDEYDTAELVDLIGAIKGFPRYDDTEKVT